MSKHGKLLAIAMLLSTLAPAVRSEEQGHSKKSYPSVGDVPPKADKPAMTAEEQLKLKKELSAARDRQAIKGAKAGNPPAKP